jgi:hypothetical protein
MGKTTVPTEPAEQVDSADVESMFNGAKDARVRCFTCCNIVAKRLVRGVLIACRERVTPQMPPWAKLHAFLKSKAPGWDAGISALKHHVMEHERDLYDVLVERGAL